MEALRPLVLGQSLAGAGGGGFLYLLTREPGQRQAVLQVLNNTPVRNRSVYESVKCRFLFALNQPAKQAATLKWKEIQASGSLQTETRAQTVKTQSRSFLYLKLKRFSYMCEYKVHTVKMLL